MGDSPLDPMIDARPLLARERAALLGLLGDLSPDEWAAASPCPGWTVHHLSVHLVHDDLRRLSAQRDGHASAHIDARGLDDLARSLDAANDQWVATMAPTLSPRLTRELLEWLAEPTQAHLASLDPEALGETVTWAGPGPHPNWLDVAREFTERWVHQQQIRQAVGRPGLDQGADVEAVVDTFARALPAALPPRPAGTMARLRVTGPLQRSWTAVASPTGWALSAATGEGPRPDTVVEVPADTFWRRAVRMLPRERARRDARAHGDPELIAAMLDLRGAIVTGGADG